MKKPKKVKAAEPKLPMQTFNVVVRWQVSEQVSIKARTPEEAKAKYDARTKVQMKDCDFDCPELEVYDEEGNIHEEDEE